MIRNKEFEKTILYDAWKGLGSRQVAYLKKLFRANKLDYKQRDEDAKS